jgi:hypothetical protein
MEGYKKMNTINQKIKTQSNEAALLNILMYLNMEDIKDKAEDKTNLSTIINELGTIYNSTGGYETYLDKRQKAGEKASPADYKDRQRQYQILASACNTNTHFANLIIDNQSRLMTNPSYQKGGLNACTFTDTNGNVQVVYRGTGSGECIDNAKGLGGLDMETPQQIEAMQYFDRVVELNGYDTKNVNIKISGHSKGGNKAQYTTINSKYSDLIEHCYNFDGQGMSPEAIEEFKSKYGEKAYLKSASKMYGFYAENDYVGPLGNSIIPNEHRNYFKSTIDMIGIEDNIKYHFADNYLELDGYFSEQTEQGHLSKLVENFSKQILYLPPKIRSKVANAVMGIMQGDKKTINGDSVSLDDYLVGGSISLPLILVELSLTPEGLITTDELGGDLLETVREKYGSIAELQVAMILANICPSLFKDDLKYAMLVNSIVLTVKAVDNMKAIGDFTINKLEESGIKLRGISCDIGNELCEFTIDVKKTWDNLQTHIAKLEVKISNTSAAVDVAMNNFMNNVTSIVEDFFRNVANSIKSFVSILGEGVSSTLCDFSKAVIRDVCNVSMQTQMKVDLIRLSDLQRKIRNLERCYGDGVHEILKDVHRLISDVGQNYNEYYVQQRIQSISMICDRIQASGRKACDSLQTSADSLQFALEHYHRTENLLCKEIRK